MQTTTFRMDKQWGPMDSTGNYIQSLGIEHDGRENAKKNAYIDICVWVYAGVCVCFCTYIYIHTHTYLGYYAV